VNDSPEGTPIERSMLRLLGWGLIGFPILFLLVLYLRFSLDFPRLDQWEFPLLLQKYEEGSLGFAEFWAQHNEHRLVFPRLIMLGVAVLTDWDVRAELLVNFLLGLAIFGALVRVYRRALPGRTVHMLWFAPPAMLVFSVAQWRNWFLGWQLQVFLSVLAIVGACALLAHARDSWWRFGAAAGLAVVAVFSFGNGMLIWPIGVLLVFVTREGREHARAQAAAWLAVGGVVLAAYLYRYETPSYHAPLAESLNYLPRLPAYLFAYLGGPIASYRTAAAVGFGVIGVVLWALFLRHTWANAPRGAWAVALGLGCYAIGSGGLTAVARASEGVDQALSSRYVTIASLLWYAVLLLLFLAVKAQTYKTFWPIERWIAVTTGTAIVVLALVNSAHGAYRWNERYNAYQALRETLVEGEDLSGFEIVYPDPKILMERRAILREHGYSVLGPASLHSVPLRSD